ncbi:hypothetical protein BsWGS_17232 [Bradybaena similaris]
MMCLLLLTMLLVKSSVAGQDTQICSDCHTKQCVSVGYAALNGVDKSVNPCDNFFKYACGGWMQQQFQTAERKVIKFTDTIEPLGATIDLLSQGFKDGDPDAVKKAKNLFKSCQNYVPGYENTISNIVTGLFGTWPLGCEQCDISPYDLERSLIETTRLGAHPLFTLSARINHLDYNLQAKNFKRYLHIDEPTHRLPVIVNTYHSSDNVRMENYVNIIIAAARNFVSINDEAAAREDAWQIVNVDKEIATRIYRPTSYRTFKTDKPTIASLNEDYGQLMNWTSYMYELASTRDTHLEKTTLDETIFIKSPNVLSSIIDYFLQLPNRTQVNYLAWRLVDSLHNAIIKPEDKQDNTLRFGASEDFDRAYRGEGCAWFVTQTLPLAVDRMLYAEYLPLDAIQKVNSMFQQLKYEFNAQLPSNSMFDEDLKRFIKEKIDSLTTVFANYFEAMDDTFLDSYYSSISINSTHEYIEPNFPHQVVMVKREAFNNIFWSTKIPAKVDYEQPYHVFSVQIFGQFHEIVLSFASMFHPWFMDQAPMVVNYAGAMYTLAYALLKSVDTHGMRFHTNGTEGRWLDWAVAHEYNGRYICFNDQYYNYYTPSGQRRKTLNDEEDFVYNVALKLAYKAYKNYTTTATTKRYNIGYSGFTNDQLFFVRAAQLMCIKEDEERIEENKFIFTSPPSEFRVIQPFMNSKDFAYAFKCRCGSPMNPLQKCKAW